MKQICGCAHLIAAVAVWQGTVAVAEAESVEVWPAAVAGCGTVAATDKKTTTSGPSVTVSTTPRLILDRSNAIGVNYPLRDTHF